MDSLLELFCHVDDFCKAFLPHWNKQLLSARRPRGRRPGLCMSEIMTILIHFHQSNYRNFKAYYLEYVMTHLRNEFPGLVSYNRFVELIPSVIVPLTHYLRLCLPGHMHRHHLHRLHYTCRVQESTHPLSQDRLLDLPDVAKHLLDGSTDSNYI
jgi:hypothetical protein